MLSTRVGKASIALALLFSAASALAQTTPDALVLYREGKYDKAIDACVAELGENPKNVESHVVLCWSLVAAKRYQEATDWAAKGREISKYDPRLIEIDGEAQYFLGQNDLALRLFQEYISYAPNGSRIAPTYYFMGEIYLRLGKFRHADMAFSAAVQLEGQNALWWQRLGYAREMAKDYRFSLEAYKKSLELNSTLQDSIRGRDRVLERLH
jgi:tetratricopeptide (TPR) repeat protein